MSQKPIGALRLHDFSERAKIVKIVEKVVAFRGADNGDEPSATEGTAGHGPACGAREDTEHFQVNDNGGNPQVIHKLRRRPRACVEGAVGRVSHSAVRRCSPP